MEKGVLGCRRSACSLRRSTGLRTAAEKRARKKEKSDFWDLRVDETSARGTKRIHTLKFPSTRVRNILIARNVTAKQSFGYFSFLCLTSADQTQATQDKLSTYLMFLIEAVVAP